jgi:hypothetical protein
VTGGKPGTGTPTTGGALSVGGTTGTPVTGGKPGTGTPTTGGVSTTTGGTTSTDGPPNVLVPQMCDQKLGQVWEGNTLDFFFNPLNDRWRIELDGTDASGRVCGTATYLAAGQPAPPAATDPDAAYPPSTDPTTGGIGGATGKGGASGAWPGATYSIIQGAEVGGVLRFRLSTNELWKDWCALQTAVPQGDHYGCIGGNGGWSSDGVTCTVVNSDGSEQMYPVAKCNLCAGNPVCTCDATRCAVSDGGTSVVFDLKVDGARLSGTVDGTMITLDLVQ